MCGIIGFTGNEPAKDIIIGGLERLEYRGYDSAGLALLSNDQIQVRKRTGKPFALPHSSFRPFLPG